MPDPSLRFEPGQCITLTSRSASSDCSGVGDPHAVRHAQPRRRQARSPPGIRGWSARQRAAGRLPPRRATPTRACGRAPARAPTAPRPPRAARASTRPRSAARTPRAGGRWPRRPSASSARGSRRSTPVVCSRSLGGASSAESIMHLPTTARSPADASASKTTSVSWTVSIVRTVVVPDSSSSDAASSAEARSVDGLCAASIGQIRRCSHSSSGMSSADPRKSVWHRWTCVWMKPGRRYPPRASMT